MYKVFIVDDEIFVRESFREQIDRQGSGFVLAGEASDGEMALSMIKDLKPDILVTDIRMPFMDGIELARIVKRTMPWVKIVILSGHDEFEYAQKAISIGVEDYILKPIRATELIGALEKAARAIEESLAERADYEALKASWESVAALNEEELFSELIAGEVSSAAAIDRATAMHVDLVAQRYVVVITQLLTEEVSKRALFTLRAQLKALAADNPEVWQSYRGIDRLVTIVMGESDEATLERAYAFAQAVQHETARDGESAIAIGIGSIADRLSGIPRSFFDADQIHKRLGDLARGKVFYSVDLESAESVPAMRFEDVPTYEQLKNASAADIPVLVERFQNPIWTGGLQSTLMKTYIAMEVLLSCSRLIQESGGDPSEILPETRQVGAIAAALNESDGLRATIESVLRRTIRFRDAGYGTKYGAIIRKAQAFIAEHYASPDISLHTVSAHVALSSNHFCTVYAQECGQSFIEYLTMIRVQHAKKLLRDPSRRTSEIAYAVGYNDPHYFSYIFKKQTGLTPRDYRAKAKASDANES